MFILKQSHGKERRIDAAPTRLGRKICLVSPGHLSTNPRLLKEAKTLGSSGFEVRIVCGSYSIWGAQQDAALGSPTWSVRSVPFGPEKAETFQYVRQTLIRKGARFAARFGVSLQVISENAHAPIVRDLVAAVKESPVADLYIAHYVAALPAAARAAQRHGRLFAFDAEDFHPGDLTDVPANRLNKSLIRAIEGRYLPKASYITAASPGIAEAYAAEYEIERPRVILNTFPKTQAPTTSSPRGVMQPSPSVYWFSQTIGPNRGLECAIRAIATAKSMPHLFLRGAVANGYRERLTALAREVGAGERLHLLPPAPPMQMESLAAKYDVGFVGETGGTLNRSIALTNKQFTYLLAGIPAVMSDVPSHRDFATLADGAAFLYRTEDPAALSEILDFLLSDPNRLAVARACAFQLGQYRFNWEIEEQKLLNSVRSVLQDRNHDIGG